MSLSFAPFNAWSRLALPVVALLLAGCSSAVTPTTLARVTNGMKIEQVEAILGRPAQIEQADITGVTGKVCHYFSAEGEGRVILVNDAVFKTEFIPEGKHA